MILMGEKLIARIIVDRNAQILHVKLAKFAERKSAQTFTAPKKFQARTTSRYPKQLRNVISGNATHAVTWSTKAQS